MIKIDNSHASAELALPDDMAIVAASQLVAGTAADVPRAIQRALARLPANLTGDAGSKARAGVVLAALADWWRAAVDNDLLALYGARFVVELLAKIFGSTLGSAMDGIGRRRRILVVGETGAGKERVAQLAARTVVALGPAAGRVVPFNVAAVPEKLIEAELFGHAKGAFTDAVGQRQGLIRAAGPYGALVLDEVGEMAPPMQSKLLRFLESDEFLPVGFDQPLRVPLHVVAMTSSPLTDMRQGKVLRSDLFHRLAATVVELPPLRELLASPERRKPVTAVILRRALAEYLPELPQGVSKDAALHNERIRAARDGLARKAERVRLEAVLRDVLPQTRWPGNLRECVAFVVQVVDFLASAEGIVDAAEVRAKAEEIVPRAHNGSPKSVVGDVWPPHVGEGLDQLERWYYDTAWQATGGNVRAVAARLGVDYQVALRRTKGLGLRGSEPIRGSDG